MNDFPTYFTGVSTNSEILRLLFYVKIRIMFAWIGRIAEITYSFLLWWKKTRIIPHQCVSLQKNDKEAVCWSVAPAFTIHYTRQNKTEDTIVIVSSSWLNQDPKMCDLSKNGMNKSISFYRACQRRTIFITVRCRSIVWRFSELGITCINFEATSVGYCYR